MQRMWMRIAVALGQGAWLWWLYWSLDDTRWPGTDLGWLVGLAAPGVLVPLAHYLIEDLAPGRRGRLVLVPLALALFGIGWHHGAWTAGEPYENPLPFVVPLAVLEFHALPFLQCWLETGRVRPAYAGLFRFAWRNALLLGFGGVFTSVLWLLLWLWAELFRMIGIDFFRELFMEAYFAIPATAVAVGIGMQLAGSVERLQTLLRSQLLTMLKWLAPLAILILALFTVTLLVKSPELLLEQRRVISAAWLLWLIALTVCLLNAAYQDGSVEAPYPAWLGRTIRWVVPLLTVVAALALYAIVVRVQSYGLTVARTWALLVALVAAAYAAGYSWSAMRGKAWMAEMGRVNVAIALGTVAMLTLMLSPPLAPERFSAASQETRVLASQEADAYDYLRFASGRYGRERLKRLAELQDHPAAAAIREAAAAKLAQASRYGGRAKGVALSPAHFEVFPSGGALDHELLELLRADHGQRDVTWFCEPADPCPILLVDLDRDHEDEALIFSRSGVLAARREEGRWVPYEGTSLDSQYADPEAIRKALRAGHYTVRKPRHQVLEIGGRLFLVEEPESVPAGDCAEAAAKDPCDRAPAAPR